MIINDILAKDITAVEDYKNIKDYLFVRATSLYNPNLAKVPHTVVGDIAITYHGLLKMNDDELVSVRITNELMKCYNLTLDQLHEDAMVSSPKVIPSVVKPLESVIFDLPEELAEVIGSGMYMISNENFTDGAGAIFYPDLLNSLSKKLDSDLFIIPSSTDECIAVGTNRGVDPKVVKDTLLKVNSSDLVHDGKCLSDSLYHYDKNTRQFERYDDYQKRISKGVYMRMCH